MAQHYFSKWPFAFAMPDQKAARIVQFLKDHVFHLVGPPSKLHSDQGRNFESCILSDLSLISFWSNKGGCGICEHTRIEAVIKDELAGL